MFRSERRVSARQALLGIILVKYYYYYYYYYFARFTALGE